MPRPARADEAGALCHALNRGNACASGEGHLYQGRDKSFPIRDHAHFLTVYRYVERNALRAELVQRAHDWR